MTLQIRTGAPEDLARVKQIYDHYVLGSHATFDIEPPPIEQWEHWFEAEIATGDNLFFVAARDGDVLGYVKTEWFRAKAAYATSRYSTVYLDPDATGAGIGSALYEHLFASLTPLGLHRVFAAIALPNAASIALHERFRYALVGTYPEVGRKFDRYWDVATYCRPVG